ncbi:MAG: T9SS type A sorting domain-containing protein, partial [Bacteroidia bacterium]
GTSAASYSNTITVNPSPTITITGTSGPICPPPTNIGNVTLTASGGVSYTWAPGPLMGTAININPATNTTYSVTGTDANGCTGTASHAVTVYALPSITAGSSSPVCASSTLCLNASGTMTLYAWSGPCSYTSFNQNDCFTVAAGCGGTYTVGGTDANGCVNQATTAVTVSPCTGIEQLGADNNGYSVYPNPASDKLFITRNTSSSLDVAIEVMDVFGKVVLKQSQSYTAADTTRSITIAGIPAGVYFIKLSAAGEQQKLIRIVKGQ